MITEGRKPAASLWFLSFPWKAASSGSESHWNHACGPANRKVLCLRGAKALHWQLERECSRTKTLAIKPPNIDLLRGNRIRADEAWDGGGVSRPAVKLGLVDSSFAVITQYCFIWVQVILKSYTHPCCSCFRRKAIHFCWNQKGDDFTCVFVWTPVSSFQDWMKKCPCFDCWCWFVQSETLISCQCMLPSFCHSKLKWTKCTHFRCFVWMTLQTLRFHCNYALKKGFSSFKHDFL